MNPNERINENPEQGWEEAGPNMNMERVDDRGEQRISTRDLADGGAGSATGAKPARAQGAGGEQEDRNNAAPLFESGEADSLRSRWMSIQTQFVDEPRQSVERADELVASAMKRLAEMFANERETLEKNWDRGEDVSTEDLRIALQRYRSFFDRLLSV
jgi:hypothetical protein